MSGQRGPQPPSGGRAFGARAPEIAPGADDREEMRALYRTTGAAAFGLALRVLHRRGAAEDVVREGYRRVRAAQWIVDEDASDCEADSDATAEVDPAAPASHPGPDLETPWGRSAFVATEQRSDLALHIFGSLDVAFGGGGVHTHDGPRLADSGHLDFRSEGAEDANSDYHGPRHLGTDHAGSGPPDPGHPGLGTNRLGTGHGGTDRLGADHHDTDPLGTEYPGIDYLGTDHRGTESDPLGMDRSGAAHTETDHDGPASTAEQSWLLAQIHRLAVQRLRLDRRSGGGDMPWLATAARLGFDDPLDSHCEVFVLAYYGGRTYRAISRELGLRVPMVTRLLAESIERLAEQRIDRWTAKPSWCPPGSVLSLADAYALDAVAELEHHHIENRLTATTPNSLSQFATRVRGVHEVLAMLAADDQHAPPRNLETRILADLSTVVPQWRGHRATRPPWLRQLR